MLARKDHTFVHNAVYMYTVYLLASVYQTVLMTGKLEVIGQ